MQHAEVARDVARRSRSGLEVYSAQRNDFTERRLTVLRGLGPALRRREMAVHFQPQVELATGRITGLEALIRWNHPTRGLLTPASFIPIAERTGFVIPMGHWIFEEACSQLKLWRAEGIAPQVLSVNVSGVQFKGASELEREIEASLTRWDIDPSHLELELTESVLMEATQRHSNTLQRLRQLGTKLSIDDFGTGYSSLSYLKNSPVDGVKLDKSFAEGLGEDATDTALVRKIIEMCHTLGLEVLAEGIETPEQAALLKEMGCDLGQGYYFAHPLPSDAFAELPKAFLP